VVGVGPVATLTVVVDASWVVATGRLAVVAASVELGADDVGLLLGGTVLGGTVLGGTLAALRGPPGAGLEPRCAP